MSRDWSAIHMADFVIFSKSQQVPARRRQTAYTLQPQLLIWPIHQDKKWCISISWREIKGNRWALTVIHNKTLVFLNNPTKTHSKCHRHMTTRTHLMDWEQRNLVDCSVGGVAIHQIPQKMKIRHCDDWFVSFRMCVLDFGISTFVDWISTVSFRD
mgnify:CR=1 FL=1